MAHDGSDLLDAPRRFTRSYYFVLIFLVLPLWSFVPLCWAFAIYTLSAKRYPQYGNIGRIAFAVSLCEVLFSLYHAYLYKRIAGPTPYGPGNTKELQTAFKRVLQAGLSNLTPENFDEESGTSERPGSPEEDIIQLEKDDPRAVDFRNLLRTWFRRVPWSSVRLHEVRQWIYWSIYNVDLPTLEDIPPSHRALMDEAISLLQKRTGTDIPEGTTGGKVKPLRLTLDPVNVTWRPLAYYVLIGIINRCLRYNFEHSWKMKYSSYDGLEYLLHIPHNWRQHSGPRPLVLFHGLGLGLFQYYTLIVHLLQTLPDRPILVLLQPHISQDIFHPRYLTPMSRHETTHRLAHLMHSFGWVDLDLEIESDHKSVLEKHKIRGVIMLSHSNGSYAHAWMLKQFAYMVSRSCFVDPVTFCSWEGDVCYNFIYRPCSTGIELLMRYFVGTELGVANLLQRHFDWASNSLWYEEIPNARDPSKTLFVLGGKDDIIRAERVRRYLSSHGVKENLWFDPDARHGQALITGSAGHSEILRWLRESKD